MIKENKSFHKKKAEVHKKLLPYIHFVNFIGDMFGQNCEVVLHDLTQPDHSIIAIKNGHVTDRQEGGPITDLALKILQNQESYDNENYITNYSVHVNNGKTLKSSSFFIKDDTNKIIGMLCINMDITRLMETKEILEGLTEFNHKINGSSHTAEEENIEANIDGVMNSIIEKVFKELPAEPDRMSSNEKLEIVKILNNRGIFLLKNGVSEVAKRLNTSEATIYRYLNKI